MKLYVVVVVVVVVVLVVAVEVALVVAEVVVVIVHDPTSKHFVGIIVQFVLRKNYGVLSCEVVLYRHRQWSLVSDLVINFSIFCQKASIFQNGALCYINPMY